MTPMEVCQKKTSPVPAARKIKLVGLNARFTHSCLALFYLRNELAIHFRKAQPEIMQLTINDNYHQTLLRIVEGEPFAVFFSAAVWNSDRVGRLAIDLRACLPDCRIIIGGPQASVLREELAPEVCSMVLGEIEAIDPAFYHDLENNCLQPKYSGAFLRLKQQVLPMPYRDEDFQLHLQNRHVYYETSRGCPHACTYCLSASESGLFHKGLDQVKEELSLILEHNPKVVRFIDRTFNDIPERAVAIWEFLISRDTDTLFHFEIAPDRFTARMFDVLADAQSGRFQFEIGIQSTNGKTLEAIRRRMDTERIHEIISRLASLGTIHLHVDLILGLPYETPQSFSASFSDVFAMGAHYIQMGLLKILPDTPICHGAEEYGYSHSVRPPYSVFESSWITQGQMSELCWFCEGVEKFHNTRYFVSLWDYLRNSGEDIAAFFKQLLVVGKQHGLFERAATQELLSDILYGLSIGRADRHILIDLLRYDWLRCGHRSLPLLLNQVPGHESPAETKDYLYQELPDELEGVYLGRERNRFLKRANYLHIGLAACRLLGLSTGPGGARLAIVPEREASLYAHNRVLVLDKAEDGESI